jgi:hypothetical protein
MMRKQTLAQQIAMKKAALAKAKPRSHIRLKLFFQLRELMLQELRREIRQGRAA